MCVCGRRGLVVVYSALWLRGEVVSLTGRGVVFVVVPEMFSAFCCAAVGGFVAPELPDVCACGNCSHVRAVVSTVGRLQRCAFRDFN